MKTLVLTAIVGGVTLAACSSGDSGTGGGADSGAQDSASSDGSNPMPDGGAMDSAPNNDGATDSAADSMTGDAMTGNVTSAIAANSQKTCAITAGGDLYCWGNAPLGDGTNNSSSTPVKVTGAMKWSGVWAGGGSYGTVCGVTTAGAAYCWSIGTMSPAAVVVGKTFKSLGVGAVNVCGLETNGIVSCWGDVTSNGSGQLGLGAIDNNAHVTPTPVIGNHTFTALATGHQHSCAVETSGDVYCWGSNTNGESGGATGINAAPTKLPGSAKFTSVAAAWAHSCGISTAGDAYCWGYNTDGRCGALQTSANVTSPLLLTGGLKFGTLSAGSTWSCATSTAGAAYCWGNGQGAGSLGNGAGPMQVTVPTAVSGGLMFSNALASDAHTTGYHSCAIAKTGAAYCWGLEVFGEDGDGMNSSNLKVPTAVVGGLTFAAP